MVLSLSMVLKHTAVVTVATQGEPIATPAAYTQ